MHKRTKQATKARNIGNTPMLARGSAQGAKPACDAQCSPQHLDCIVIPSSEWHEKVKYHIDTLPYYQGINVITQGAATQF